MCLNILQKKPIQSLTGIAIISAGASKPTEYCHDGYVTDVEFGKEILDQVNWYHMHTTNYEYDTSNGKFQNSIIYKQGD